MEVKNTLYAKLCVYLSPRTTFKTITMKRTLLSLLCLAIAFMAQAQQWTAPVLPAEDVSVLDDSEVVYIYNVKADAFIMYGLAGNNQACATRLTNGDYAISIPQQTYVTYSTRNGLRLRNKERGNSYYISCPNDNANNVVINKTTNASFSHVEVEEGSHVYGAH